MTTFDELVETHTGLAGADLVHIRRLIGSWRTAADLSFSDLLLYAPVEGEDAHRFVVLAQMRSTTGQTIYPYDMVGTVVDEVEQPLISRCFREGKVVSGQTKRDDSDERVELECIPVHRRDRRLAVVTREETVTPIRRPGEMERMYRSAFDRLARMICEGTFPFARDEVALEAAPRVSDGVIILDAERRITYASPNAVSSLHRMGIHASTTGERLRDIGFDDAAVRAAARMLVPAAEEIERGEVSILLRVIPFLESGGFSGAVILMRDVTDLRNRDRMLMSKDATIREIHHRVKNNLQTIASLLRLQGRRLGSAEARVALAESERRIRSIAIVHETLSREPGGAVDFAEIVRPLLRVVEDSLTSPDRRIALRVEGEAGELPGDVATSLAVVLNELMQNAVDHAFPGPEREGHVDVRLRREGDEVHIHVHDDGIGLPERFSLDEAKGLGLSIVQALVTGELGGSIEMRSNGGTEIEVRVDVGRAAERA